MIRSSGQLTVTNAVYTNSCNSSHDAFDIFGPGGSLSAPDIRVVGGWETHNGDNVIVGGVTCPLLNQNPPAAPVPGCPVIGQSVITDPFANVAPPGLGTPACTSTLYGSAVSYTPTKPKLSGNITATQTTIVSTVAAIANGDMIQIDNEQMLVTGGGGTFNLTVQRAMQGTSGVTHSNGKEIKLVPVVGTGGTAALPASCKVSTGTVTLQPGTYYGGICIGAGSASECGTNVGGSCDTTSTGYANVTLAPGNYIMAGGGFFLCGSSTLSAPNVLIYNTQDPTNSTGAGALDQVLLNTSGSVSLGPQTTGVYAGLSIFQDRNLAFKSTKDCDSKSQDTKLFDIGLVSMASSGPNGPLGSVSGTIYAAANRALFADSVGGRANLAVMTSCILIDGGTSTFDFQMQGLFGVTLTLQRQWG